MDAETEALLDVIDQQVKHGRKESKKVLNFGVIQQDWESLLAGMTLKLEREFPTNLASAGAREFLWLTFRVAVNAYKTMAFVCADKPPDPHRKLEYAVSCPPVVRTLVDSLFNVIFALEDLERRVVAYHKSGWREHQETLIRYEQTYGKLSEWQGWLEMFRKGQEHGVHTWGITEEERQNTKAIKYWPLPSQMIRYELGASEALPETRAYLQFLNDWFYRELSQESHLSFPGLAHRAGLLIALDKKEEYAEEHLSQNKSTQMVMAVTLLLALCSEIEHHFNFGFKDRIVVLWGILCDVLPIPREVYQERYSKLLGR